MITTTSYTSTYFSKHLLADKVFVAPAFDAPEFQGRGARVLLEQPTGRTTAIANFA
jgi:hypothetical protein